MDVWGDNTLWLTAEEWDRLQEVLARPAEPAALVELFLRYGKMWAEEEDVD